MIKKKIFVNLVLLVLTLLLLEFCCYCIYFFKYKSAIQTQWDNGNKVLLSYHRYDFFSPKNSPYNSDIIKSQPIKSILSTDIENIEKIRTYKNNSSKRPLCFVGCSYTEGVCLTDEETFAYNVSQKTGRTVYLRGVTATGLAQVYYQIVNKIIPNNTEYIVYTFINDHLRRLYQYQLGFWSTEINLRYKIKNGEIQEVKKFFPLCYSLYFTKLIQEKIVDIKAEQEIKDYRLFKALMADMMINFKKNYPDSKFVFLYYPENEETKDLPKEIKDYIKSIGCIYLNANKLSGESLGKEKWKVQGEGIHPNAAAWQKILPNFLKELKLDK